MRHPHLTTTALSAGLTLTLTLGLAGCGFDTDESESNGGSSDADSRLSYAYAFTPVAALSPYSDDAVTSYGAGATETLAALDPAGTPQPQLATRWEQVDPTTWRFDLATGVTFHDGTAMTADTVAASLTTATEAKPLPRALTGTDLTVTADGGDAVIVTTAEPDPVLVQRLTSPELAILAPSAYAKDPNAPTPVGTGTGPYEITSVDGTASMTLDAFAGYRDGAPALHGVDVTFVADGEARATAYRAGQVDLAQALPAASLGALDEDDLVAVPLPRTVSLHLTQTSDVFADPGMRAAAREAVSGLDLAGTVYDGYADAATGLFAPAVSSWAAGRPAPTPPPATDTAGASITLATFSDRPEMSEIATVLADALREKGFEVKVVVQEYNQLESAFLDGTYDAVIMSRSYGQDTADPISYLQTDFGCAGTYNLSLECDEAIDDQLADAAGDADLPTRESTALDVEAQLLSDVVVVPLVHDRTQFGADGVDGLAEDPWERAVVTAETTVS